jgi:hypothetical protein
MEHQMFVRFPDKILNYYSYTYCQTYELVGSGN